MTVDGRVLFFREILKKELDNLNDLIPKLRKVRDKDLKYFEGMRKGYEEVLFKHSKILD